MTLPIPTPEELKAQSAARREHIADIVAKLVDGLQTAPYTEGDWASWTDFASDLLVTIYRLDDEKGNEVYPFLMYLDGCEPSRLKDLCWKVVSNLDEPDADLRRELLLELSC